MSETIERRLTDEQLFKIEQKMQAERVRYILRTKYALLNG